MNPGVGTWILYCRAEYYSGVCLFFRAVSCRIRLSFFLTNKQLQYKRIVGPGLNCICWPFTQIAGVLSLRIQQLDVVCETKSKDNVRHVIALENMQLLILIVGFLECSFNFHVILMAFYSMVQTKFFHRCS